MSVLAFNSLACAVSKQEEPTRIERKGKENGGNDDDSSDGVWPPLHSSLVYATRRSMEERAGPYLERHRREPSIVDLNFNTNWLGNPQSWVFYLSLVAIPWAWLYFLIGYDIGTATIITHITHFIITFYLLHWHKGSPVQLDQGVHDSSTFWEQIDSGMHFTPTKKFLTAVPMLLYMLVLLTSRPSPTCWAISTITTIILIVAKVPMMHGVRIFGINKGSA